MTVVPIWTALINENLLAVNLATYARIVGLRECLIYGVNDGGDSSQCDPIWSLEQRQMIARYLYEAQTEIESVTGFFLHPTYVANEQHIYRFPLATKWNKLIEVGTQITVDIALAETIDYTADPSVIGPVATTVTDESEIVIFHEGTDVQIIPSKVTISGGNVTIEVPRCRLVNEASQENPVTGWDYNDVPPGASSPFADSVDIKQVYIDELTGATLVFPHSAVDSCSCGRVCEEATHTACAYIRRSETGLIDLLNATYTDKWTLDCGGCRRASYARVSYLSGMNPITVQAEDALVRLAHSKAPLKICGCDSVNQMWERDRKIPDSVTSERANNPFGLSDGAWIAWKWANSMKIWKSGVL